MQRPVKSPECDRSKPRRLNSSTILSYVSSVLPTVELVYRVNLCSREEASCANHYNCPTRRSEP
jgi:hypothetical protein